ncbi:MAG TPA: efflux transporter outer membrane subunit [Bryobacteraceae bacterium]|nr:efflux transporter outer membrane subunit [Bryobacteraceae bacterium]
MKHHIRAALIAAAFLLSSCMVGPKYKKPDVQVPAAFKEAPPDSFKETKDWKFAQPGAPALPPNWWEAFADPQLTALEEQAVTGNQNLKIAEARFRQARALIRFNRASEFPTISTTPGIASVRESANRPYFPLRPSSTGDFTLPFDLSYEVDLWGRVRRTVNAAREEAQATAADLATATLSIQAELAYDYFELRAADAQKQLLDDTVKAYSDALRLTQNRFEGGAVPKSDVAQAQTQFDTATAQQTDIGVERAQYEHAIATLLGKPPAQFSLAAAPLGTTPPAVPVGLPSQLLERRPDVAAAERRIEEANEQIGIARAAFFPTVTLGASAGIEGSSILNWLNWPSRFWAVGPSLAQTLFDAGRRHAGSDAAVASYDAAVANYRETTLTAFQQVEDSLAALRILENEEKQQRSAVASAEEALQIFINRYQGGVDNYLQVITAQTTALTNQRNEIDIQRRRMDASVLLIKALGGGWNIKDLPTLPSLRKG